MEEMLYIQRSGGGAECLIKKSVFGFENTSRDCFEQIFFRTNIITKKDIEFEGERRRRKKGKEQNRKGRV